MKITFSLNGSPTIVEVTPNLTLLSILRDEFGLTAAKPGCDSDSCGACTVIIDGEAKKSCIFPANNLAGTNVITVEGLSSSDNTPNDLQLAFLEHGSSQCGYCTPGILMAGEALLAKTVTPSRIEIREAIAGNLCRCTGYVQIVDAIEATAKKRSEEVGAK